MKNLLACFSLIIVILCIGNASQSQNYIVLTSIDNITDDFFHSAYALADYRDAEIIVFDPENLDLILPELIDLNPRYVAVVVKPEELHINFIREFLMMSTMLDDDPFSDFSYGFITGATADDALNFVNRIIQAESENIEDFPLNIGGYVATTLNLVYEGSSGWESLLNSENESCIWLETNDDGSGRDFFLANTSYMENNKMLDIGQNGDAHMLWLFDGGNMSCDPPSWIYDEAKIEDPAYARTGLSSYDIATLNLYPAVAFNGACHAGETKTVMVEGDIEATFGDTQGLVEFYTMSDTFSFALSILNAGITGYFAPCGANNANDQGEDVYNAFLYNEPLGDIHKRSVDGVVMGFLGNRPNLRIFEQGESTYQSDVLVSGTFDPYEYSGATYMLGGKANRIYFGDPLFNPYANDHTEEIKITTAELDSVDGTTLDITLGFNKPDGYWPMWDKFHFGDTRIYYPVELPWYCSDVTSFEVIQSSSKYELVIPAVEYFDGKTILHIEVDIPDDMYDPITYSIKFRINYTGLSSESPAIVNADQVKVYPNPCSDFCQINFANPYLKNHSILVYNIAGELVEQIDNITSYSVDLNNAGKPAGMYFFRLICEDTETASGRFVVE
jgi:hypothetical protein